MVERACLQIQDQEEQGLLQFSHEIVSNTYFKLQTLYYHRITANDIKKTDYLKAIFEGNSEEAMDCLREVRSRSKWDKEYEHDFLMAFWLAVHMEDVEVAQ